MVAHVAGTCAAVNRAATRAAPTRCACPCSWYCQTPRHADVLLPRVHTIRTNNLSRGSLCPASRRKKHTLPQARCPASALRPYRGSTLLGIPRNDVGATLVVAQIARTHEAVNRAATRAAPTRCACPCSWYCQTPRDADVLLPHIRTIRTNNLSRGRLSPASKCKKHTLPQAGTALRNIVVAHVARCPATRYGTRLLCPRAGRCARRNSRVGPAPGSRAVAPCDSPRCS